jgi:hypothetical protein
MKRLSAVRYIENNLVHIVSKTNNDKTGNGFHSSHFLAGTNPIESRIQKLDSQTTCKDCVYSDGKGCYTIPLFLNSIWKQHKNGRYYLAQNEQEFSTLASGIVRNDFLRFGNFGNPSLMSIETVERLYKSAAITTGYTAEWRTKTEYNKYLMASVQNLESIENAADLGFRTFLSIPEYSLESTINSAKKKGISLVPCINYTNPSVTCKQCGLCDGVENGKKSHIINPIHGFQKKKAEKAAVFEV